MHLAFASKHLPDRAEQLVFAPDEVHVWITSLQTEGFERQSSSYIMQKDEQQRADRFRNKRDSQRFAESRALLKQLLGRYLNIAETELRLCTSPQGKPVLAETCGSAIQFNLSHSSDKIAYAFAIGRKIGVDIEKKHHIENASDLAARYFHILESNHLKCLPIHQQNEAFLQIWARKEAYVKAIGEGWQIEPDSFDVVTHPASVLGSNPFSADLNWTMIDLELDHDLTGALAVERLNPTETISLRIFHDFKDSLPSEFSQKNQVPKPRAQYNNYKNE